MSDKSAQIAIRSVASVTAILKGRFPNLTTEETVNLAAQIFTEVMGAIEKERTK